MGPVLLGERVALTESYHFGGVSRGGKRLVKGPKPAPAGGGAEENWRTI